MSTSHDPTLNAAGPSPTEPTSRPMPVGMDVRNTLRRHVLEHIQRGEWVVGQRLPTEMELAGQFETSRSNVNQAMKMLEREGIVQRFRRRGSFVAGVPAAAVDAALEQIRPRDGRVHVVASRSHLRAEMHWNRSALEQLESVINEAGLQMVHRTLPDEPTLEMFEALVQELSSEGSRAMVLLTRLYPERATGSEEQEQALLPYVQALLSYPGRVCWLNRAGVPLASWPHDAVSLAPLSDGVAAGQYLKQQNASEIVAVGLPQKRWSWMRVRGLEMALRQPPRPTACRIEWGSDADEPTGIYEKLLDEVESGGHRPTIVVPNDHRAVRLLDLARERGLSCPEAFSLISFDNDPRYREYNITTVAPPAGQIGETIGQLVSDQLQRPGKSAVHLTLKAAVVERATFAPGTHAPAGGATLAQTAVNSRFMKGI